MKTITQEVYLKAKPSQFAEGGYEYSINPYVFDNDIEIYSEEITMTVPDDFDPTNQHIEMLKAEKQRIQAEAHLKAENIEEQIQSLLCIEDQGEG